MNDCLILAVLALGLALGGEDPAPLSLERTVEALATDIKPAEPPADASATEPAPETTPPPASKPTPGIRKLDRKTRAKVLSALAGFVILWLALIVFIWYGARYTRRYMRGTPRLHPTSQPPIEEDDWARKRLVPDTEEK